MLQANDVASVILSRSGPWTDAMRLQKLLYYVQAWHLAITDKPLFTERIKAWKDGPVVPDVWHKRKDQASRRANGQPVSEVPLDELSSDLIDLVLGSYGSMSAEELSALTHVELPWLEARGDVPEGAPCSEPISESSMARYYRAHRKLAGWSAADLAAGGIHPVSRASAEPVDIDQLLAALGDEFTDPGEDCWGGANLDAGRQYNAAMTKQEPRRSYAGN